MGEESKLINVEDLDWESVEKPLASLNLEGDDNVDLYVDDGGGNCDENILITISNFDPYCLLELEPRSIIVFSDMYDFKIWIEE